MVKPPFQSKSIFLKKGLNPRFFPPENAKVKTPTAFAFERDPLQKESDFAELEMIRRRVTNAECLKYQTSSEEADLIIVGREMLS